MYEGHNFCFVTPRLAKCIAALKLATVMSTPHVTPAHPKSAVYTADWAQGCESGKYSQSSEDEDEDGAEVEPRWQLQHLVTDMGSDMIWIR